MIYTAKEGIEKRTKEKILTAELIIVPLIMFGVTAYGLMGSSGVSNNPDTDGSAGVTLGTSTESSGGNGRSTADTNANVAAPGADIAVSAESSGSAASTPSAKKTSSSGTASTGAQSTEAGGRGGEDSSGSSCPCQTIGDVLQSLTPTVPVQPLPTSPPTLSTPTSGTL